MKTINLLELLAKTPHYSNNLELIIATQPEEIKKAIATKDGGLLRRSLSKENRLANMTMVVQA